VSRSLFPARLEHLPAVLDLLRRAALESGLGPSRLDHLDLVIEEAFVNICRHGGAGEVAVEVCPGKGEVTVELADDGAAFDPTSGPLPALAEELAGRSPSGLGTLLVRTLADDVRYRRDGGRNVLRLVLRRRDAS
jgi:serine/threonine-protein kinase RsbW